MSHPRNMLVLIVCLAIFNPSPTARGETPPKENAKTARTDRYGDPLPDGVMVRLGTTRLRHSNEVHQVAFAPDGKSVVSCDDNGWVHRWDAATGKCLRSFRAVRRSDSTVLHTPIACLSRDGRLLATVAEEKDGKTEKIILWETVTGKPCGEIKGRGRIAFSTDGKMLATGNYGGVLKLFETATGRELRTLHWGRLESSDIAFSPDGKTLAAAASPNYLGVALWTVSNGIRLRILRPAEDEWMVAVAFAPDGKTLATGTVDGTIQLWDLATGKVLHSFRDSSREKPWSSLFLIFSPDGRMLVMGDAYNDAILFWSTATGKVVRKIEGIAGPNCAAFSPDGKTLVTGDTANRVRLWDVATGKEKNLLGENAFALSALALSPDGKVLATSCADRAVRLWMVPSGKPLRVLRGHEHGVYCLAFSPDGGQLATGDTGGVIRFWDPATGRERRKIETHERNDDDQREPRTVAALAFSPDGKTLASGGFDSRVRLWDATSGKQRHVLADRKGWVFAVAFTPDGKTVAGGGFTDGSADTCLWDTATGKLVRKFKDEGGGAQTLAFSPDGKVLVAAGGLLGFCHLDFVEAATGKCLARFDNAEKGEPDDYLAAAVSADGRTLALGSTRGVFLWEMASRRLIREFRGEWGGCGSLAFTPDCRTLIVSNGDGTVHFRDLTDRADAGKRSTK